MRDYLRVNEVQGAECAADATPSHAALEGQIQQLESEIAQVAALDSLTVQQKYLKIAYLRLDQGDAMAATAIAREVFTAAMASMWWQEATEACDVLFQAQEGNAAVKALAHGIWLGVTFPIDAELSVAMLQHLIDETPDNADGAAVAAAVACYLVDLRVNDTEKRDDLIFFTTQLLGQVARRHSQIDEQELFNFWVERMQLDDPTKFLPRLATILDVLVAGDWWFDRDALRDLIPEEG
ncbi:MAG: hypothetical protein HQL49_05200 [Gammaproteobacteria bacterium]|nr:hypothetical protein [Gammaproteobacteria bacterium]